MVKDWKEILSYVIRIGVGGSMMIAGTVTAVCGVSKGWHWPDYLIVSAVIIVSGLLAVCLDVFKELRRLRIELETKRKDTQVAKNYNKYLEKMKEEK